MPPTRTDPNDSARRLLEEGTAEAANRAIDLLRQEGPPDDPDRCALLARAYFLRGDARGDVYSSHYFAGRALALGATDTWVTVILGVAAFRKDRFDEAVEALGPVVTPASPPGLRSLLGLALLYAGRTEDAAGWIEAAAGDDPEDPGLAEARSRLEDARAGRPLEGVGTFRVPAFSLGGVRDRREEGAVAPYAFNALSKLAGDAREPKDFDWVEKNIPCQAACPARTDIPEYLKAIYQGDADRAYRINLRDNVFPAVLGRVCSRPCEAACRHGWDGLGEPVAICFSKRSAADFRSGRDPVVMEPWFGPSGKTVAVIGAGVAGLAAARNLALLGHKVVVFEKHNKPGGMMNQGIPKFRLPWDHIEREVEQIARLGVEIRCDTEIGRDVSLDDLVAGHDAVVLAAGTLRPNLLPLPGHELDGIRHGLDFLLEANENDHADVGEHVVVIGGGFTAMDCARTARRLGARDLHVESRDAGGWTLRQALDRRPEAVRVRYRRGKGEMLVTPGELEELDHEGIPMDFMVSPVAYIGSHGRVTHMRLEKTELGEPDASGRRRPVAVPGSSFEVPADTVLLATGQFPDTSWITGPLREQLVGEDQWLVSGAEAATGHAKIFAAGDFATGASSLIEAIAHGKRCARTVDARLSGRDRLEDRVRIEDLDETGRIREMDAVPRQPMPTLPLEERTFSAEVEQGFTPVLAVDETQRCYFCHTKFEIDADKCIYCDWCIKAKPRPHCIVKVKELRRDASGRVTGWEEARTSEETNLIWINQEDCIRCNACVEACPVDCISVQKVSLLTDQPV